MPYLYDTKITYTKNGEEAVHDKRVTSQASAVEVMHQLLHQVMPVEGAGLTIDVQPIQRAGGYDGASMIGDGVPIILADPGLMESEGDEQA